MSTSPIRLLLPAPLSFGPGKAELLEHISRTGSLQAAAAAMDMSYMKAWRMVKGLNAMFSSPLVTMQRGGKDQGGAGLTPAGHEVLTLYHEAVATAEAALEPVLVRMNSLLAPHDADSSGSTG
ncbi:LysR family transcriptional regulator [Luteolibacter sp. SL250]|uniref:winged helix-turn-helix domain-containing protein n=1 Tax=Luteolibacter sp. SL250 TaxID=2995170 RepID=UPI00226E2D58|nr:LysR family transcriptional regulator [Luteolibacter sp. SL250]WAC17973.1 LysR family transcriptional regulator [Luteolibacter sp. SL250]